MSPPNKYSNCVYCNVLYEPIDYDKHLLCKEFYNFTLEEVIKRLETRLKICYEIKKKNPE